VYPAGTVDEKFVYSECSGGGGEAINKGKVVAMPSNARINGGDMRCDRKLEGAGNDPGVVSNEG
jgi:hypothetical protein